MERIRTSSVHERKKRQSKQRKEYIKECIFNVFKCFKHKYSSTQGKKSGINTL